MTVLEVSEKDYKAIEKLFDGYVFRREEGGKFFVKLTVNQMKRLTFKK